MFDPNIVFTVARVHRIIQLQAHVIFKYKVELSVVNNNMNINVCDFGHFLFSG